MIFVCLLLIKFILVVKATHFLGATLTWHPLNASATGTPVAVVIIQTYLWRYTVMACTNTMITNNQFVPIYGSLASDTLNCIANCVNGSIGYVSPNVIPYCVDSSVSLGISVGQRSDIVYLQAEDDFAVAYQSQGWRPLTTGTNEPWSISLRINVKTRSDNGLYNNAPVATVISLIFIPVNQSTTIHIPIGDADGDTLRCRWATQTNGIDECAGVCPPSSLPVATVIYPNCTIIIMDQTVGDWYAVALMVEDFINSTSTIALSSIPVQFLVNVVAPRTCTEPPEIIGGPSEDSCTVVQIGQTVSFQLTAINECGPSVTIDDIATLDFSGMVKSNLIQLNSTTYFKNFTWTPAITQIGYQVMCAMAIDSQKSQSAQYCFKFYVSTEYSCTCPGVSCPTTSTSSIIPIILTNFESTRPGNYKLLKGISIGILVGILLLLALIVCSCLCWYYCSPWGIDRYELSDCAGPFEFYYLESVDQRESIPGKKYRVYDISNDNHSSCLNDSNDKTNLWFNNEYITKSVKHRWFLRKRSYDFQVKIRPVRKKPRRVTIFSLPSEISTSALIDPIIVLNYHRMNPLPYHEKEINGTTVQRVGWIKKK